MDEARLKLLAEVQAKAKYLLAERDRIGRQKEEYARSLRAYAEAAWHVIEPAPDHALGDPGGRAARMVTDASVPAQISL